MQTQTIKSFLNCTFVWNIVLQNVTTIFLTSDITQPESISNWRQRKNQRYLWLYTYEITQIFANISCDLTEEFRFIRCVAKT